MSDSFIINRSEPSSLTSVPDHFPNKILSPGFTFIALSFPSSVTSPGPTATTSPSLGFSLAVSGIIIPPAVFSSLSSRFDYDSVM